MNQCRKQVRKRKRQKYRLVFSQLLLLFVIIITWEALAYYKLIDTFLFSSPSRIINKLILYIESGELFRHIGVSVLEVVLGIIIGSTFGIIIAAILWYYENVEKVLEPFIAILNALPKTALAPIMIIWAGTGVVGIVVVALSILLIITIISTYNHFSNVDSEKIRMVKSFKANRFQIFVKVIFPSNVVNLLSIIKINVGMSWIGVIVGEFLVSRAGIGYLIMYGGQVFDLDLVMMGVFVLAILAFGMWFLADVIEKRIVRRREKNTK